MPAFRAGQGESSGGWGGSCAPLQADPEGIHHEPLTSLGNTQGLSVWSQGLSTNEPSVPCDQNVSGL